MSTLKKKIEKMKCWKMQIISSYTGHQCYESEEENGIQDAGQTLILFQMSCKFPVKKVTRSLYEMFEWHSIIQELLAIECGIYDSITSRTVQKQSTI